MNEVTKLLKSKKLKVTPQRIAIFNVLYNSTEHPNAETIYNKLSQTYPTMSLATVYKTLDAFKKTNLVQELNVGEDSYRYDANTKPHPHILCLKCNKVDDIQTEILNNLKNSVQTYTNYTITNQQVYFYGYCPNCKDKN